MNPTKEQQAIIDSLRCERLSSDRNNLRLVGSFYNRRNNSLADILQNEAYEEDIDGSIAYYVVKNAQGDILFFFSLKSGLLYDQHIDEKTLKFMKKVNTFVQDNLANPAINAAEVNKLTSFLEKIRSHKGITKADLEQLPNNGSSLFEDLELELNKDITHVGKTYSAVELVHFCANDAVCNWWDHLQLPCSLGTLVFWHFIVPIVLQSRQLLGIQYFFLFAADLSEEGSLVKYYNEFLKFTLDTDRATVKPLYDLSCKFMYQETKDLEVNRFSFFSHFNTEDILE